MLVGSLSLTEVLAAKHYPVMVQTDWIHKWKIPKPVHFVVIPTLAAGREAGQRLVCLDLEVLEVRSLDPLIQSSPGNGLNG